MLLFDTIVYRSSKFPLSGDAEELAAPWTDEELGYVLHDEAQLLRHETAVTYPGTY